MVTRSSLTGSANSANSVIEVLRNFTKMIGQLPPGKEATKKYREDGLTVLNFAIKSIVEVAAEKEQQRFSGRLCTEHKTPQAQSSGTGSTTVTAENEVDLATITTGKSV